MHSGSDDRTAFLRKRFREGDRFTGTVIRYLDQRRALIRIEGKTIMAWMDSTPPAGRRVEFVVDRLIPFVVLRQSGCPDSGVNMYI